MDPMYAALIFIVGFIVGGLICVLAFSKFSNKASLLDDLTKTKRELARVKRTVSDYFTTADNFYCEMDKKYQTYIKFMQESAKKICPESPGLFDISAKKEAEAKQTVAAASVSTTANLPAEVKEDDTEAKKDADNVATPKDFVVEDSAENKEKESSPRI
ncbi:DUF1043 family protein [uncultured Succinatimonas sp.]|uniref:ZapG family protein n=1 Tax=uncultured Succinatimonas sp. TaxID=1262973 RepID=UPI0025F9F818|nr:DUF1043 family protein [uncultured Succinatimonas sp.]